MNDFLILTLACIISWLALLYVTRKITSISNRLEELEKSIYNNPEKEGG